MAFSLRLSQKIPASIIIATLITGASAGLVAERMASQALLDSKQEMFAGLLKARNGALSDYMESIQQDINSMAGNEEIIAALKDFGTAYEAIPGDAKQALQKAYIDDNKNALGEKEKLDYADDGSDYSAVHKKYHPWFRGYLKNKGYYDIFLINKKGDVVYTVFKELDFATNVAHGEWKDSDIGTAYRNAMSGNATDAQLYDFKAYAPSHNIPAGFIAKPILDHNGEKIGVLVFQLPIANINNTMDDTTGMGKTGETFLVGADKLMRSDSRFVDKAKNETSILVKKVDTESVSKALKGEQGVDFLNDERGVKTISAYLPFQFMGVNWAMIAKIDEAEATSAIQTLVTNLVLIVSGMVAFIGVAGLLFSRTISKPITHITHAMEAISQNQLQTNVPARNRHDEIGEMAAALQVFKENAVEMEKLKLQQVEQEKAAAAEKRRMMRAMADDFEGNVQGIISMVASASTQLCQTADNMKSTVTDLSRQAGEVSESSSKTSGNVQNVAAAIEEMSASVNEIAGQVSKSTTIVNEAVVKTRDADSAVQSLVLAVGQIGEISSLIESIAGQINLLALNATIESARAGEAGRGFAVVASEVKNLATQTANATTQIIQNIENVKAVSGQVESALAHIQLSITNVNQYSSAIAAAVEEQSAATREITGNMHQASEGVRNINENIEHVSQGVGDADTGAIEVLSAANMLSQQSEMLNQQVALFLSGIRKDNVD